MTNNHVIECRCDECHNRKQAPFRFSMPDNERETFTVLMPKKEASKKGMAQWLADAAADPRSRKAIGGISLIGAGTYGATQAMTKRRKAND